MKASSVPATLIAALILLLLSPLSPGITIVWDFEGEQNLTDQTGTIAFGNVGGGGGAGGTWARNGVDPSAPVRYDAINDEFSITPTPGGGPNDWLVRADWNFDGVNHQKHGDGDSGILRSGTFLIDETSSFRFDVGGGSAPNGLYLRRADDDSVILSESRGGGFVQQRDWSNVELTGAGVTGKTEVYLTIEDQTTGGWGNVSVDNIVAINAEFVPVTPRITSFAANPATLAAPGDVTLEWEVGDTATAISIDNGVGDVTGMTSIVVPVAVTTTFTLTATNAEGDSLATATVGVAQTPLINSFTASQRFIRAGDPVTLSWEVLFADSLEIDNGVGEVTGSRLIVLQPLVNTTYILTATNGIGSETAQLTVEVIGPNLVWDFEGRVVVEGDPIQDRLYDQEGRLKFHLVTPGDVPPGSGNTFDRHVEGIPSNPVRYDAINDESPITDTPGADPTNEWLIRADWNFDGITHMKHADGDTGEFISDSFGIDQTSFFTMDVGGGSNPNGFFLHRVEDDSIVISEHRGGGFVQKREWTNAELTGAGVSGPTEVYLRIADATTGGWGNVSVDNIAVFNATVPGAARPFEITNISHDAGSDGLTIKWESEDGFLYNLRSQTDPSGDPASWPIYAGHQDLAAAPPENSLTFPLPADLTRLFVVERFPAPPAVVFAENFDAAAGLPAGWVAGATIPPDTGTTHWQVGTPSGIGPPAANSAPHCAGTNISAAYGVETEIHLRTGPIDLTTAGGATLTYAQFRDIEVQFDFGTVRVLKAADESELSVLETDIDGDSAGAWEEVSHHIPAAALGNAVLIEFRFRADDFGPNPQAGWYFDNIQVTVP